MLMLFKGFWHGFIQAEVVLINDQCICHKIDWNVVWVPLFLKHAAWPKSAMVITDCWLILDHVHVQEIFWCRYDQWFCFQNIQASVDNRKINEFTVINLMRLLWRFSQRWLLLPGGLTLLNTKAGTHDSQHKLMILQNKSVLTHSSATPYICNMELLPAHGAAGNCWLH